MMTPSQKSVTNEDRIMRLIGTILLLCVSLNGYATCSNSTPENMSHYAYMTEDELNREYCYCRGVWQIRMDTAKRATNIGAGDMALEKLGEAGIISDEMTKIARVLKKDYGTGPKECKK